MSLEITQADRDDYAEFSRMIGRVTAKDADAIRDGGWDDTAEVRWFAEKRRHRSTSTEEVERLKRALNQIADLGSCAGGKAPAHRLFQQALTIATEAL